MVHPPYIALFSLILENCVSFYCIAKSLPHCTFIFQFCQIRHVVLISSIGPNNWFKARKSLVWITTASLVSLICFIIYWSFLRFESFKKIPSSEILLNIDWRRIFSNFLCSTIILWKIIKFYTTMSKIWGNRKKNPNQLQLCLISTK